MSKVTEIIDSIITSSLPESVRTVGSPAALRNLRKIAEKIEKDLNNIARAKGFPVVDVDVEDDDTIVIDEVQKSFVKEVFIYCKRFRPALEGELTYQAYHHDQSKGAVLWSLAVTAI